MCVFLDENEERTMVDPAGNADSKLVELKKVCLEKKYNIFLCVLTHTYFYQSVDDRLFFGLRC